MGIGRQQFRDALAAFRAARTGPSRRRAVRDDVNEMLEAARAWLVQQDAQLVSAEAGFAADRPAQFSSFVDALPPVDPDPTP
jgi:hypothetical protein